MNDNTDNGRFVFMNCGKGKETAVKVAFSQNDKTYILVSADKDVKSLIIPAFCDDGVNGKHPLALISKNAFDDCQKLVSVEIENGVLGIDTNAFRNCVSLKKIFIPASVSYIASYAFLGCINLTVFAESPSAPTGWRQQFNPLSRPIMFNSSPEETSK